jgi:hypothetical protein
MTLAIGCAGAPSATPTGPWLDAPAAFPALRDRLIGTWRGTTADGAAVAVTYQSIAGDSSLLELWGTAPRLTATVFHPDGGGLVATHYCAQGNQPRLRAVATGPSQLEFRQADATDVDDDEAQLVSLTLRFDGEGFERVEDYLAADGQVERTRWQFVRAPAGAGDGLAAAPGVR